jgi:hypothetical protein
VTTAPAETSALDQAAEFTPAPAPAPRRASTLRRLIARFGVAGLIFFTVKGLLWLTVPAAVVAWRTYVAQ